MRGQPYCRFRISFCDSAKILEYRVVATYHKDILNRLGMRRFRALFYAIAERCTHE
jgi:hypothetical protein